MKYKYYVALTGQERWMVIESPNRFRNKLISAGGIPMPWMNC